MGLVISSLSRSNKQEDQLKSLEAIRRDIFFSQKSQKKKSECIKNHSVRIAKKYGIKFLVEKVRDYVSLEQGEMCASEKNKGKSTSKEKQREG